MKTGLKTVQIYRHINYREEIKNAQSKVDVR